jgi:hypothetical protein
MAARLSCHNAGKNAAVAGARETVTASGKLHTPGQSSRRRSPTVHHHFVCLGPCRWNAIGPAAATIFLDDWSHKDPPWLASPLSHSTQQAAASATAVAVGFGLLHSSIHLVRTPGVRRAVALRYLHFVRTQGAIIVAARKIWKDNDHSPLSRGYCRPRNAAPHCFIKPAVEFWTAKPP